jgi:hypothetical protein
MNIRTRWLAITLLAALSSSFSLPVVAQTPDTPVKLGVQQVFASPEEAVKGLVAAVRAVDPKALLEILGPDSAEWLFTGDDVADRAAWQRFLAKYDEQSTLEAISSDKRVLNVGDDQWPFPAPVVKRGERWSFDADAGREEVINRRVGHNELSTIETLRAVVDAQREYAANDADNDGFNDYAMKFNSSVGKRDGLYWPANAGEQESPLGPLLAQATQEGYGDRVEHRGEPKPYHGYLYRILTRQGDSAPGGAFDYLVRGKLIGGFALVAYPVTYGLSGVKTFIVNHDGTVYENDLGTETLTIGAEMTSYEPDSSWSQVTD